MASCDPNTLTRDAGCFFCLPPGYYYPLKLALLCRWWKLLAPTADCSVNALMADAKCFACLSAAEQQILKLTLLCRILGGGQGCITPAIPSNFTLVGQGIAILKFTWTEASDPSSGFTISYGITPGGPYDQGSATYSPSARAGDFPNSFFFPDRYFVIRASNGMGCVSDVSNEVHVIND